MSLGEISLNKLLNTQLTILPPLSSITLVEDTTHRRTRGRSLRSGGVAGSRLGETGSSREDVSALSRMYECTVVYCTGCFHEILYGLINDAMRYTTQPDIVELGCMSQSNLGTAVVAQGASHDTYSECYRILAVLVVCVF